MLDCSLRLHGCMAHVRMDSQETKVDGTQVVAACLNDGSIAAACELASWSECAAGVDVTSHADDGSLTVDVVADASMATACTGLAGVVLEVTVGVIVVQSGGEWRHLACRRGCCHLLARHSLADIIGASRCQRARSTVCTPRGSRVGVRH